MSAIDIPNETINYNYINMLLDEYYSSNDIESTKTFLASNNIHYLFHYDETYYSKHYETRNIMRKIALFNNIDIIDIIMHHANNYIDNYKQQDAGCYIAAILYKNNFDATAEEIINKYYLDKGEIILNMYINKCDFDKIKYMISNNPESIQASNRRTWLLAYSARYDAIHMIKFLQQYYEYNSDDIFNILFNFSKSIIGSKELYIYIFNNYIDIIKNETLSIKNLITEISFAENYELIYFILSKIQFDEIDMIHILSELFSYPPFFDKIIENITNIMLNVWNMSSIELKQLYSQIDNQKVSQYIHSYL